MARRFWAISDKWPFVNVSAKWKKTGLSRKESKQSNRHVWCEQMSVWCRQMSLCEPMQNTLWKLELQDKYELLGKQNTVATIGTKTEGNIVSAQTLSKWQRRFWMRSSKRTWRWRCRNVSLWFKPGGMHNLKRAVSTLSNKIISLLRLCQVFIQSLRIKNCLNKLVIN